MIKATFNYPTAAELLSIIGQTEFKPFDQSDWMCWAGCNTANPLIGYSDNLTIIIDGEQIGVYHEETIGTSDFAEYGMMKIF